jgi:alcohol dehydrogenase class IV
MHFEFATSSKIIFGIGALGELNQGAMKYGNKIFLLLGGVSVIKELLLDTLKQSSLEIAGSFRVIGEPSVEMVNEGIDQARKCDCNVVIGCGGGSVIDTAKAIAALLTNTGNLIDYLEIVGSNHPLEKQSVPMIAIPTTAGTGSEVTRNSVLSIPDARIKVSLRSPHLLPMLALIDPMLTLSLPPQITATTGLDALTQLLESFPPARKMQTSAL